MSSGVRELRVWQESVALAGDVIRAIKGSVRRETKCVSDHVLLTALAIGDNIAEGYGKHLPLEQRESYLAAKCALLRLETELAVAKHADLIPAGAFTEITGRTSLVARLLAGYIVYLDRLISEAASPPPRAAAIMERPVATATLGSSHAHE
jgi:four helix bundle protein